MCIFSNELIKFLFYFYSYFSTTLRREKETSKVFFGTQAKTTDLELILFCVWDLILFRSNVVIGESRSCTMSHFLIKQARKIRNKSLNCAHICLTITKITINSCSKFSCERQFYVIFVIVILHWQIQCGILKFNGLVLR